MHIMIGVWMYYKPGKDRCITHSFVDQIFDASIYSPEAVTDQSGTKFVLNFVQNTSFSIVSKFGSKLFIGLKDIDELRKF